MLFFGTLEGLCYFFIWYRNCAVCWKSRATVAFFFYSRGTVLLVGIVEGLCYLLVQ